MIRFSGMVCQTWKCQEQDKTRFVTHKVPCYSQRCTTRKHSPIWSCSPCSGNSRTSAPRTAERARSASSRPQHQPPTGARCSQGSGRCWRDKAHLRSRAPSQGSSPPGPCPSPRATHLEGGPAPRGGTLLPRRLARSRSLRRLRRAVPLLVATALRLLLLGGGRSRRFLLSVRRGLGQRKEAGVQQGRVEREAAPGAGGGGGQRAAGGQRARPQRALHGGVGPRVHLHAHLLGVGPAQPRRQPRAHLRQQRLELRPAAAVQIVGRHRGGWPNGEGAEAAALVLLPARLLRCRLSTAVGRQAAPEALERAERGKDEALHGGTCRKVS